MKRLTDDLLRITGADGDTGHLDEDWENLQAQWERLVQGMRPHEELEKALEEHPASWRHRTDTFTEDNS